MTTYWMLNEKIKKISNNPCYGLTENLFMMCDVIIDIFIWLDVSSFFEYDWFHSWFHSVFWFIFSDCASQFFRIILQLRKVLFTFSIVCLQWTSLDGAVGLKLIFSTLHPTIAPRVRRSVSGLWHKWVYLPWKTLEKSRSKSYLVTRISKWRLFLWHFLKLKFCCGIFWPIFPSRIFKSSENLAISWCDDTDS